MKKKLVPMTEADRLVAVGLFNELERAVDHLRRLGKEQMEDKEGLTIEQYLCSVVAQVQSIQKRGDAFLARFPDSATNYSYLFSEYLEVRAHDEIQLLRLVPRTGRLIPRLGDAS